MSADAKSVNATGPTFPRGIPHEVPDVPTIPSRRLDRSSARSALLALGALFLPADATDGKIKQPGIVQASWSSSDEWRYHPQPREPHRPGAQTRRPASNIADVLPRKAVIIQRQSSKGWKSGMMLTPAGARDLAMQIVTQLHGASGSVQIYNHWDGQLNATHMRFTARDAYGLAYHLLVSAQGH